MHNNNINTDKKDARPKSKPFTFFAGYVGARHTNIRKMKAIITLVLYVLISNTCIAENSGSTSLSDSNTGTLITTKSVFSDKLMFTCDITNVDIDPFIFNTLTKTIVHPIIFTETINNETNEKFKLLGITDEYLFLERVYAGTKHRTDGKIKEQIYILRYASKIGNRYAVKAKSKIYVNDKEFSGNTGQCDVVERLF